MLTSQFPTWMHLLPRRDIYKDSMCQYMQGSYCWHAEVKECQGSQHPATALIQQVEVSQWSWQKQNLWLEDGNFKIINLYEVGKCYCLIAFEMKRED